MGTHIWSLRTTLLVWVLCPSPSFPSGPATPTCPHPILFAPASPALESLECRNDYSTNIHCSWTEVLDFPLSLFHMDPDDHTVSPCVRGPLLVQNALGWLQVQCQYNTSLFAIGFDDVFFFHTPHSPGLSRAFNLKQHARRNCPHDITGDGQTRCWFDPKPTWVSLTPEPRNSTLIPDPSDLRLPYPPSSKHPNSNGNSLEEERSEWSEEVRARGLMTKNERKENRLREEGTVDQFESSGADYESSGWIPVLFRKTDTDSLPGPFNLQCVYDGEWKVKCSWEMKRELTQVILYNLSYRMHTDTLSEWCCAESEDGSNDNKGDDDGNDYDDPSEDDYVVKFSCLFSVSEADLLLLDLKPQPRTKVVQSYKHIEPVAPVGLTVEVIGQDWVLNWTLPKYRTVPITSELRYWSTDSPGDIQTVHLLTGVSLFVLAESSLLCPAHYLAHVRCSVTSRSGRGARYTGYPSDWSEPVQWTTRTAPASGASRVYFLLAASVSITVILTYFTLLTFHRKVKVWEVSLPSPFQSKALKAVCQAHGSRLPSHIEVDNPCMSEVCVLGDIKQLNLYTLEGEYEDVTAPSTADGPSPHWQESQEEASVTELPHLIEVNQEKDSGPYPTFPSCLSVHHGLTQVRDGRCMHLSPDSRDVLQPCSEGYQQSPGSNGDTPQDNLLDICLEDVEMSGGYMDCPK
ncbi:cytokine receptor common subunit beta-like [Hoplias malabaricus]|uniref:cytokine receptor common subunit beta-like n=1 Tax=Hoplias malabaricus TaxID=27720 RepID=UPI003462DB17